ncbi:MAG: bifunctional [glutamine synthetase] adenylyltransferase/[glutamine synthetase]-adenylyl-L-tyrosine phosphorylase [Hyphomicrobiaceae bacterium]|nr:bifunctional [glutamine synthetase] adenylyltransferase/[glutamine synthetase]-adenylyl-L-tyrosine phosphorylase [Hyphomicrobiaceae bacterium]
MTALPGAPGPLHSRIRRAPLGIEDARIAGAVGELEAQMAEAAASAGFIMTEPVRRLLGGVFAGSPYVAALARRDTDRLVRVLSRAPEATRATLLADVAPQADEAATAAALMAALRGFKNEIALLTALADLGGVWELADVTGTLTEAADSAVQHAVRFLFRQAVANGSWLAPGDPAPERSSGYVVLGMGKYGARELNYSSDIDLIVFYDRERLRLRDGLEPQLFLVRMTRELVRILQERTGDGYVFRTDLRLRPDPGATQIALSSDAALTYYESFGQNWERAAMIKARPVAGDIETGEALLGGLAPFIWRKYLDFAAIADIHAMKRQIHAHRGFGEIGVAGHNIKLGRGGIREIEFFAQTQQLIAGGRQSDLRAPETLVALDRLAARGWIKPHVRDDLARSYVYLRGIEHRLQMVADEQTHELPDSHEALAAFARFAGYPSTAEFSTALVEHLELVQRHYAALFEDMPELTRGGANMVFAGESDDPQTLEALARMGYSQPHQVIATMRGWHHGRYPAVRSAKARERLTEVQAVLIEALAQTANPDSAFAGFDRFLAQLPAGVQLFSLLRANPGLLRLVADIMGSAPRLARILSRRRRVLDAVLDPRVIGTLPTGEELDALIREEIETAADFQEVLDRARVIGNEQAFLIGVRILSGIIVASQAGGAYALLADHLIHVLQDAVERDFARVHGRVPGGAAAVVAMGKLGGREMTAASDLDLIVVYDFDSGAVQSDGPRPLPPSQYYARLTQRLISTLSSPTAEGQLYEVDMRLRPSGQKGPVATQLSSFIEYQARSAWTWEHMALTRARVITGAPDMRAKVEEAIREVLVGARDRARTAADVREMRGRIAAEKGTQEPWDLKQVRGGIVDMEFMAQHLQLVHAAEHPGVLDQNTVRALQKLDSEGLIPAGGGAILIPAARLLNDLTQIVRLCVDGPFRPEQASQGLKDLLARAADAPGFERLEADLRMTLAETASLFDRVVV